MGKGRKRQREAAVRISDLDARIADLEAQLAQDVEEEEDNEEDKEEEEEEGNEAGELERIPPLPKHLLPAPGISKAVQGKGIKGETAERGEKEKQRFFCDACNYTVFDLETWKKHKRTLLHRQNVVLMAGAAYEPARKRSCYCRPCALAFDTPEALFKHRETDEHKQKVQLDRKASFCQVCKKQFTSALQLQEHIKGKVHKETLESLKKQWAR